VRYGDTATRRMGGRAKGVAVIPQPRVCVSITIGEALPGKKNRPEGI
jgi:hypothetical protein